MIPVADPFMAGIRPTGLQKGRGGFLRSADDSPYVTDPGGNLVKSGERKGQVARLKYGSPSNRGREIENDAGLVKYKQRLSLVGIGMSDDLARACKALVDMTVGSPEFNSAADSIAVEADKLTRSSLAADRGTHGHLLCERWDRGEGWVNDIDAGLAVGLSLQTQHDVEATWRDMLAHNGLQILAIEAACVDDTWRLAGTLDRIVRTTKPLTFVKPGGELVTIPNDTVIVLDIKFGKTRKAHPIQIASYAQSVPYDTDAETRGEWPWPIDQTHALIAHGDFGDEFRPVSIELVWVDLAAGRDHGGQCVVDAKAWAARDDVFSVAQIVEGVGEVELPTPSTLSPVHPPAAGEGADVSSGTTPSPAMSDTVTYSTNWPKRVTYDGPWGPDPESLRVRAAQVAKLTVEGSQANSCTPDLLEATQGSISMGHGEPSTWPLASPDRLALVDARSTLCATPDEGADLTDGFDELWDRLRTEFDQLPPAAKKWRSELAQRAQQRGVSFLAQEAKTERRYSINRGLIALAIVDPDDDILRELLAIVLGEIAWFVGIEPGHLVGSLDYMQAAKFAHHVDLYISPPPAA